MALVRKVYKSWTRADIERACKLCLITSPTWLGERSLHACVAEAVVGGATFVQLRNKSGSTINVTRQARDLAPVCRVANIPLVVNDDIEAAKTAGIDGIHIDQSEMECAQARRELGADAIVGVTVHSVDLAEKAASQGASYLSVGNIFANAAHSDERMIGIDELQAICRAVDIPVVAFGGINSGNISDLAGTGVGGVAVMSAILASPDIEHAARSIKTNIDAYLQSTPQLPII